MSQNPLPAQEPALREQAAQNFKEQFEGKLEPEKLEAALAALRSPATAYPAEGRIAGFLFYMQTVVEISAPNYRIFEGDTGGLFGIGGGSFAGQVETYDLARLTNDHDSYWTNVSFFNMYVMFYDSSRNLLGLFWSGSGGGSMAGSGGGRGGWRS